MPRLDWFDLGGQLSAAIEVPEDHGWFALHLRSASGRELMWTLDPKSAVLLSAKILAGAHEVMRQEQINAAH